MSVQWHRFGGVSVAFVNGACFLKIFHAHQGIKIVLCEV